MKDKVQLIKEEIERRISNLEQIGDRKEIEIHFPEQFKFIKMYEGLLQFIESLPEEPVSEDLEEASWNYSDRDGIGYGQRYAMQIDFKAGARWQKQQMMKDALDGCVTLIVKSDPSSRNLFISTPQLYKELQKYEAGDKLKIIIIKED